MGGIILSYLKTYIAIKINTVWYYQRDRHIDQWNRLDCPEGAPYEYSQLIFGKSSNTVQCRTDSVFLTNGGKALDIHRTKTEPQPKPHILYTNQSGT